MSFDTLSAPAAWPGTIATPEASPRAAYLARAATFRAQSRARSAEALRQPAHGLPTYNVLLCSANRHNFLPAHPTTDARFYEQVMEHRDWAGMDEHEETVYTMTDFTGDQSFLADIQTRPRVFCTLHLGSYRLINHFLGRHGVRFTLVVDNATLQNQGDKFLALREASALYQDCDMRILNAESANIGLQMMREVKAGRSLLFYIDGNTGVGGMSRQDEKLTVIPFLGRHIFARKGIAFLAHVTQCPIVPVASFRRSEADYEMHFFPPIVPDVQQPREAFAVATTQHIFGLFETLLRRYPEQWEGWLYLNHFVDQAALRQAQEALPAPAGLPAEAVFNQARYGLFYQAERPQLFDRYTYQSFNVSAQLVGLLQNLGTLPAAVRQSFAQTPVYQDLCRRQVLVASTASEAPAS